MLNKPDMKLAVAKVLLAVTTFLFYPESVYKHLTKAFEDFEVVKDTPDAIKAALYLVLITIIMFAVYTPLLYAFWYFALYITIKGI